MRAGLLSSAGALRALLAEDAGRQGGSGGVRAVRRGLPLGGSVDWGLPCEDL